MTSRAKSKRLMAACCPLATMLEKIGFQKLVEETLAVERTTKVMSSYQSYWRS